MRAKRALRNGMQIATLHANRHFADLFSTRAYNQPRLSVKTTGIFRSTGRPARFQRSLPFNSVPAIKTNGEIRGGRGATARLVGHRFPLSDKGARVSGQVARAVSRPSGAPCFSLSSPFSESSPFVRPFESRRAFITGESFRAPASSRHRFPN